MKNISQHNIKNFVNKKQELTLMFTSRGLSACDQSAH